MGSRDLAERLLVALAPLRKGDAYDIASEAVRLSQAFDVALSHSRPALVPVAPASGAPAPLPGAPLAAPSPSLADAPKPARIVALPMPGSFLTYGKTYDVIRWDDSDAEPRRYPVVICDLGHEYRLTETKWEAAPSPAATGDTGEVEKARAKVVDAAIALRMADAAYVALHTSVKDDDDALQEARGRLDHLHAARMNKRFDLDAYTTELLAATGGPDAR